MEQLYYLAYGSNLHPLRLRQRVPSATLIGTTVLANTQIVFHKHGADNSGKCTILKDTTGDSVVHAVVYSINTDETTLLDQVEGKGYYRQQLPCRVAGTEYSVFTYIAVPEAINPSLKPFLWYKELVLAGAHFHRFPERYVARLAIINAIPDHDIQRARSHQALLSDMDCFAAG